MEQTIDTVEARWEGYEGGRDGLVEVCSYIEWACNSLVFIILPFGSSVLYDTTHRPDSSRRQ